MCKRVLSITLFLCALAMMNGSALFAQVPDSVEKTAQKTGNAVTDTWIKMKLYTQFAPEKALDESDIDVDIKTGMVTLNGTVVTAAGRDRAVAIAKATDGVKGVTSNLRIAPAASATSDGIIKAKIYGQLMTDRALEGSDVDVDVDNGVVTLKGHVRSAAGQTRAAAIAKGTAGVKSVTDNLTVK